MPSFHRVGSIPPSLPALALGYDVFELTFAFSNPTDAIKGDTMRNFFWILLVLVIETELAVFSLGQNVDPNSLIALRALSGVVIQEKDGLPIGIDFRKCKEGWATVFPKLLDVPSLQSVTMTGPLATHERIVMLAALPNLKSIRLDQSLATDETVAAIVQFPMIEDINLEGCPISDAALLGVSKRENVKRLRLAKTKISDMGLAHIKGMKQLELLDLSDCVLLTSDGMKYLKGLTKLRNLSIGSPLITDEGLPHLANLTNMVAISFKDCAISDSQFESLSAMSKLKEFDIFKTRGGDRALAVVSGAKEMTKLKLRDSAITSNGLVEHISKFVNLVALDLGETETTDQALVAIAKLGKLEDLNLLRTKVTDEGIAALSTMKLKRLNLDDIASIGDGVVSHVAKIQTLEFLHLGKTRVTDSGIQALFPLTNLKDLILNDTAVSGTAIEQLQARLPKVKIVR